MVFLSKIYTKQGDSGMTALIGGKKVSKATIRLEAFGTIDKLNSVLGVIRTHAISSNTKEIKEETEKTLKQIQNDLFDIGSLLATQPGSKFEGMRVMSDEHVAKLENRIDEYQQILENLSSFTLPGGTVLNAYAHLARTICRRAERIIWKLHADEPVPEIVLKYVNRLSDFLFVYSRWVVQVEGGNEFLWDSELEKK